MERMASNTAVNGVDSDKIADLFKKFDDKRIFCSSQDIPDEAAVKSKQFDRVGRIQIVGHFVKGYIILTAAFRSAVCNDAG
ncbi:hypothetical protein SDC9_212306 [bioreactor metagenome]|uniref:Uncharacterized protein n=1 Tax=bioreactor metagenome TaxID=1076179 RepID=A0A645JLQ3_9ZZZZ